MVQKTVGILPGLGLPGQEAVLGSARYLAYNPLSDGSVVVGGFAFAKTFGGTEIAPFAVASGYGAAEQAPLGFVERVQDATIANLLSNGTNVIPEGEVVTVALQGQFYCPVPSGTEDVRAGWKVFVAATNGRIFMAEPNIEDFITPWGEQAVFTGWTVVLPNGGYSATYGDVVTIQKLN